MCILGIQTGSHTPTKLMSGTFACQCTCSLRNGDNFMWRRTEWHQGMRLLIHKGGPIDLRNTLSSAYWQATQSQKYAQCSYGCWKTEIFYWQWLIRCNSARFCRHRQGKKNTLQNESGQDRARMTAFEKDVSKYKKKDPNLEITSTCVYITST